MKLYKKILWMVLGAVVSIPLIVAAANVTVPTAPSSGYGLVSNSVGTYNATTTSPWHAGFFYATSTTSTSTFSGPVQINANGLNTFPVFFVGTSTNGFPLYGEVQGDVIDGELDFNGTAGVNIANANSGSCASSGFFGDGNIVALNSDYAFFGFLNGGWTGAGCAIGNGTERPESTLISNPTGDINFELASTSNAVAYNFFTKSTTKSMVITNQGMVGIGTTSPTSALEVNGSAYASGFFNTSSATGGYEIDGILALQASSTIGSTLVGQSAGTSLLSTSLSNTALGFQAMLSATTTNNSVAIGWQALKGGAAETALNNGNVAIGAQSMFAITTGGGTAGNANTAVGSSTLRALTSGQGNTAMGAFAGLNLTTGTNNTIVGINAQQSNVSSASAFGLNTLKVNTATGNSGFGANALAANSTGVNDAFGNTALSKVTTSSFNAAFAVSALASTTGQGNSAFGSHAGVNLLNFSSASSTFIGSYAAGGTPAGWGASNITVVGAGAGFNLASSSNNNAFFGTQSGLLVTAGSENTLFGTLAGQNVTTGSNNIAIGFNAVLPSATANNQLNIGNIIFGTSLPATTSSTGLPLPTGLIGIGTTSPYATLSDFAGGDYLSHAASTVFSVGSTTAGTATSTLFSVSSTGKIGLGLDNPVTLFSNTATAITDTSGGSIGTSGFTWGTPGNVGQSAYIMGISNPGAAAGGRNALLVKTGATDNASFPLRVESGLSTPVAVFTAAGNVGISSTTPNTRLTVVGGNVDGIHIESTGNAPILDLFSQGGGTTRNWRVAANFTASGLFEILGSTATGGNSFTSRLAINAAGNVGIGTTTPDATLQVKGSMAINVTRTATDYTVATTSDLIVAVTSTASARNINLPQCTATSSVGTLTDNHVYTIKDESGAAATNNITVSAVAGQLIDGAATSIINTNYGKLNVFCDGKVTGGQWFTY